MIKIYCNKNLRNTLKINNIEHYCPAYNGESVGLDLYNTGRDIRVYSINKQLISTGLHVIIPSGFVGLILERGSITKTDLKSRAGVIDPGYTGEVFVNLVNLSSHGFVIESNKRLPVQLVVTRCDNNFEVIDENEYLSLVSTANRLDNKVGSSG